MKRFSERMEITKPQAIQLGCMNEALRNSLWNLVLFSLDVLGQDDIKQLCNSVASGFLKIQLDTIRDLGLVRGCYTPDYFDECKVKDWIKKKYYSLKWCEVYDFIEFLIHEEEVFKAEQFHTALNGILERENSAYRWVDNKFAPLTNEQEIKEIEEAIEKTVEVGLEGAATHLSKALSLLAKKPQPDYPNSIKESISAVASLIAILSGKGKDDFVPVLEELSKKMLIHGALKQGFIKIYGYTSDEDGIRHAMLDEPNVGLDEAKFMLVSCSAFTNYLISKAQKAGLL